MTIPLNLFKTMTYFAYHITNNQTKDKDEIKWKFLYVSGYGILIYLN